MKQIIVAVCMLSAGLAMAQVQPALLRVGLQADIRGLDPRQVTDASSGAVLANIFDNLVAFDDKTLKIIPALATTWDCDPGFQVWTYTLRKGVKFHDGTPLTAEAVVKSLDASPNFPHQVAADDEGRVVITLNRPNANFNQFLAEPYYAIVSPKMPLGGEPVSGTGPFRFVSWERGKKVILQRNPEYWRAAPALETVEFLVFNDQEEVLKALRSGAVDLASWLVLTDIQGLKAHQELVMDSATGNSAGFLTINTRRKPFDDPRVRRAIAAALDPAALARKFFAGTAGAPAASMIPPALFPSDVQQRVSQPERARALLKEVGWDSSKTYILLQVWAPRPYMPDPAGIAKEIQTALEAVGIKVKIDDDPVRYFERLAKGEFDLALNGWIADSGDPVSFLAANLHSEAIGHNNVSRWSSKPFDEALDACRVLDGRPFEQKFREVLRMVEEQVPLVPLFYGPQTAVWNKRMQGFTLHPSSRMILYPVKLAPAVPATTGS